MASYLGFPATSFCESRKGSGYPPIFRKLRTNNRSQSTARRAISWKKTCQQRVYEDLRL